MSRVVTLAFLLLGLTLSGESRAQMDLHAHLDLKPGVGPLLRGDFAVPPLSLEWDSTYDTKASSHSLTELSAPTLIVASLYGHPYLSVTETGESIWSNLLHFDRRENVRRAVELEYQHLIEFTGTHPEFAIAKTPTEAENLIAAHRVPIVLSIEGAYGTLETEDDLRKWIDERGVAIVTPFHLNEDHFGGVALLSGIYAFVSTPIEYLRSLLLSGGDCLTTYCRSTRGMTNEGRALVDSLLRRHVWVDLAHANDLEITELLQVFRERKLPLLVTHTSPRVIYPAERGISDELMLAIQKEDGIVGLIPTEDMMKHSWTGAACFSGLLEFRQSVQEMIRLLGPERVVLASDINAPLKGLSPLCAVKPGQLLSELEERGFYIYTQWRTLAQYVAPDIKWDEKSQKHFIEMWRRAVGTAATSR